MSKRLMSALLGALVVALLAAGCGGGGDDSSSTASADSTESSDSGSSLTKAEFIKQGDEICAEGDAAIEEEANELAEEKGIDTENPTEAEQEEVVEQVVGPAIKRQGEEIADLGPPQGEEEAVEEIVAAVGRGADEIEEDPGAVVNGQNPLAEASKLAAAYGFKRCGSE